MARFFQVAAHTAAVPVSGSDFAGKYFLLGVSAHARTGHQFINDINIL